ncbi:uncharacterized protein LOC122650635 [Telopea speciosissima]|uniref:uncharacterized protein LOC122650635 n=1 Tax=Telopea speciosissima TaxID=54955 RepID=UPI001CC7668F|nr:uncharacterized protein LOC122650635 [Telopea speciosissima]
MYARRATNDLHRLMKAFKDFDPRRFEGNLEPREVDEWIIHLEDIFGILECTDDQKVKLAVFKLSDDAKLWWKGVERLRTAEGPPLTWQLFKDSFNEKYFPAHVRNNMTEEFMDLKQKNMTVAQYESKFSQLCRYAPHMVVTEELKADKFVRGLRTFFKNKVSLFELKTFAAVVRKAYAMEKGDNELQSVRAQQNKNRSGNFKAQAPLGKKPKVQGSPTNVQSQHPICAHCGKRHGGTCFKLTNACFSCGQQRHRVSECPNPKKTF